MTAHWDEVYRHRGDAETSWFEPAATESLAMLDRLDVVPDDSVIDVGGGTSRLVDALLARGHQDVTVLDVSGDALERSRDRLGDRASAVDWVVADITTWMPARTYRVWHDRAVFHFLIAADERAAYARALQAALSPGGVFVVATFAPSGPEECSGLAVARYDADGLATALGPDVEVVDRREVEHVTPWGAVQPFTWIAGRFR